MTFPFEVPADLTALSAEEFAAFAAQVRTHAQTVLGDENASAETLVATRELFAGVTAEETRRTELDAAAQAARAELAAGLNPEPTPEPTPPAPAPTPTPAPEPVPAPEPGGSEPVPAVVASRTGTGSTLDPAPENRPRFWIAQIVHADVQSPACRHDEAVWTGRRAIREKHISIPHLVGTALIR